MKAEKILISEGFALEIIPVPKQFSSDCGLAIRIRCSEPQKANIKELMTQSGISIDLHTLI